MKVRDREYDENPFTLAWQRAEISKNNEFAFLAALRDMAQKVNGPWSVAKVIAMAPDSDEGQKLIRGLIDSQITLRLRQHPTWREIWAQYKKYKSANDFGREQILRGTAAACKTAEGCLYILEDTSYGSEAYKLLLDWARRHMPDATSWKKYYLRIIRRELAHSFYQDLTGEKLENRDPQDVFGGLVSRPIVH